MGAAATEYGRLSLKGVLQACCLLVIILFVTILCAQQVEKSKIYRQSAFVSMIVSKDSVGWDNLLSTWDNLTLVQKFLGAVTDAYINFELIPVNEANTFAAIYESLNEEIEVERFAYQRKNLTIYGGAASLKAYRSFAGKLEDTGHFESVTGHYYITTEDTVRFELECVAVSTAPYLEFGHP